MTDWFVWQFDSQIRLRNIHVKRDHHHLRWFISNCCGNENLLKPARGEVYDAHSKNRKKVGVTELLSKLWQVQYATFSPIWRHLDPFTSYRTIAQWRSQGSQSGGGGQVERQSREHCRGVRGHAPPGKFWNSEPLKRHFVHFGVRFYKIQKNYNIIIR